MANIPLANKLTDGVVKEVEDMFTYHVWKHDKIEKGNKVASILMDAVKVIIENVPPSSDRTVAIRKLREARMDCNSAITHEGKY